VCRAVTRPHPPTNVKKETLTDWLIDRALRLYRDIYAST
jgi:hypothetical protein